MHAPPLETGEEGGCTQAREDDTQGILPIMGYTGILCPIGVPFAGLLKVYLRLLKRNASYSRSVINQNTSFVFYLSLQHVSGLKRVRGWTSGRSIAVHNFVGHILLSYLTF